MKFTGLAVIACILAATANALPHAKRATCKTDDDCAGTTCCNLNTLTCVDDPNNTICDIPPTKLTFELIRTAPTGTPTSCACTPGYSGLKNGGGPTGACCTSSDDCQDTCNPGGQCGVSGATPTCKTTSTTKTTTTTKTSTTTKTTTTASPTSCACTPGYSGLKNGGGPTGACCTSSDDCQDTCNPGGQCGVSGATPTCKTGTPTSTTKTSTSATSTPTGTAGKTVIVNANTLCFFLPPSPGGDIADSEKNAIAFCNSASDAPGAKAFPSGFIQTSVYRSGTGSGKYVQYTGLINPSKYGLSSSDEGGQYDNHGAGSPPGSICSGYPYYVNLVEPAEKDYCIRCCMNSADCPTGRSTAGCQSIIPGDYSIVLSTNSPLTQNNSAVVSDVKLAVAATAKQVIWTAPTRHEVASNATLRHALEKAVFPLNVGLDKPVHN
ncbi:hypothetical protein BC940DRAFT_318255 [Gongronella butleri]|nr:hypothetical protein BC940DRAFT_318255 [Gongronella butleri]